MTEEGIVLLAVVIPITIIVGGVVIIVMAMRQRSLTLELMHRERMAMIERGIVPGPGGEPEQLDAWPPPHVHPPTRATRMGVVVVALGVGLMLMIGFAGNAPGAAVGVGGSVVVLGVAFIVNGELRRRTMPRPSGVRPHAPASPPGPLGPSDPPGPVGP